MESNSNIMFTNALEKLTSGNLNLSNINPAFISLHTPSGITPVHVNFVENEEEAIQNFLSNHKIKNLLLKPVPMPLKFDSVDHEINYWVLKNLLDFGSGFQIYFKESVARSILFGLVNLIIQGNELLAEDLLQLDEYSISQIFRIEISVEVPHESIPAVRVDKALPTKKLVEMMKEVLHDAARKLLELQCESFAQYLRKQLQKSKDIGILMNALTSDFKGFTDEYKIKIGNKEEVILINSKVQSLIKELHANIGEKDELFNFQDLDQLTVSISGVIPGLLERLKLITISDEMKKSMVVKPGTQKEFELRRVSLEVTEKIVKASNGAFRGIDLDYYLYKLVKNLQKDDIQATIFPICPGTYAY